jgi:hypothetical protein
MWVVDGVHRHATHRGTYTAPTRRTGLAKLTKVMLAITDLTQSRPALDMHATNFT